MSLAEIEAELEHLGQDELRRLALRTWKTYVEKEQGKPGTNECSEDDPVLLASLDDAIAQADASPCAGKSARDVRERLKEWTTK